MDTLWISSEDFWEAVPCLAGLHHFLVYWKLSAVKIPPHLRHYYFNKRVVRGSIGGPAQQFPGRMEYGPNAPWVFWLVLHSNPEQQSLATVEWFREAFKNRPTDAFHILDSTDAPSELKERVLAARAR